MMPLHTHTDRQIDTDRHTVTHKDAHLCSQTSVCLFSKPDKKLATVHRKTGWLTATVRVCLQVEQMSPLKSTYA